MSAAPQLTQAYITSKIEELPTLPTIVYELSRVINDPMSSTSDVEKLMANDQSLTTKVLKLVNSAYYAIPGGVSSLSRAIAYIGFDTVNQLVLAASILKALDVKGPVKFDLNEFWKHAIGVGIASETIGKYVSHPTAHELFTAGLVHDMGKVAMYTIDADTVVNIVAKAKTENLSYLESEAAMDVPRHTTIGYMLALKWNLPISIQSIIKNHHNKDHETRGGLSSDLNRNVDIVYLANLLIHALKFGNSGHNKIAGAPKDVLERLTLSPEKDLKPLLQAIKTALEKASDFMKVLGSQ